MKPAIELPNSSNNYKLWLHEDILDGTETAAWNFDFTDQQVGFWNADNNGVLGPYPSYNPGGDNNNHRLGYIPGAFKGTPALVCLFDEDNETQISCGMNGNRVYDFVYDNTDSDERYGAGLRFEANFDTSDHIDMDIVHTPDGFPDSPEEYQTYPHINKLKAQGNSLISFLDCTGIFGVFMVFKLDELGRRHGLFSYENVENTEYYRHYAVSISPTGHIEYRHTTPNGSEATAFESTTLPPIQAGVTQYLLFVRDIIGKKIITYCRSETDPPTFDGFRAITPITWDGNGSYPFVRNETNNGGDDDGYGDSGFYIGFAYQRDDDADYLKGRVKQFRIWERSSESNDFPDIDENGALITSLPVLTEIYRKACLRQGEAWYQIPQFSGLKFSKLLNQVGNASATIYLHKLAKLYPYDTYTNDSNPSAIYPGLSPGGPVPWLYKEPNIERFASNSRPFRITTVSSTNGSNGYHFMTGWTTDQNSEGKSYTSLCGSSSKYTVTIPVPEVRKKVFNPVWNMTGRDMAGRLSDTELEVANISNNHEAAMWDGQAAYRLIFRLAGDTSNSGDEIYLHYPTYFAHAPRSGIIDGEIVSSKIERIGDPWNTGFPHKVGTGGTFVFKGDDVFTYMVEMAKCGHVIYNTDAQVENFPSDPDGSKQVFIDNGGFSFENIMNTINFNNTWFSRQHDYIVVKNDVFYRPLVSYKRYDDRDLFQRTDPTISSVLTIDEQESGMSLEVKYENTRIANEFIMAYSETSSNSFFDFVYNFGNTFGSLDHSLSVSKLLNESSSRFGRQKATQDTPQLVLARPNSTDNPDLFAQSVISYLFTNLYMYSGLYYGGLYNGIKEEEKNYPDQISFNGVVEPSTGLRSITLKDKGGLVFVGDFQAKLGDLSCIKRRDGKFLVDVLTGVSYDHDSDSATYIFGFPPGSYNMSVESRTKMKANTVGRYYTS